MHIQVLASGSKGNSALVRAEELSVLVDAGLPLAELEARLELARVAPRAIGHLLLSHGHLDHARSAGLFGKKTGATVHCCERLMGNASLRRAPRLSTLSLRADCPPLELCAREGDTPLCVRVVRIPHDADPTVAFSLEHRGRKAVIITDMGEPDRDVARALAGAHVLVLEFNHDLERLRTGPYPAALKARVAGSGGHLSNVQAAAMLAWLAGGELHTLVLAHLSEANNTPELAREVAERTLAEIGARGVRVLVASQSAPLENIRV